MSTILPSSSAYSRPRIVLIAFVVGILLTTLFYIAVTRTTNYANRDFMSLWSGGRAILDGVDPYDPAQWTPLRAQYGSIWQPDDTAPFPLWTSVLFVPFAAASLDLAAAIWLGLTVLMIVGSVLMLLLASHNTPKPSRLQFALLVVPVLLSRWTLLVLLTGQMTGLLLSALALFVLLEERGRYFQAGLALSLIVLKPNPFLLFAALVGVWLLKRRQWHTIVGGVVGVLSLLIVSWMIQPGWISSWTAVTDKTVITQQTPTVWGLAWEVTGSWWPLVGLLLVAVITAASASFVLRRQDLDGATVTGLGLTLSLLTTPYTWVYEHLLLLLPLALLLRRRYAASHAFVPLALFLLAVLTPWLFYRIALSRGVDTCSAFVPFLVLTLYWAAIRARE